MKKALLTVIISLVSLAGFSQKQGKSPAIKADSNQVVHVLDSAWVPTDSTEFITIRDISSILNDLTDKVSYSSFIQIQSAMQTLVDRAILRKRKNKVNK